ncbi:MAG TPA: ATP-binding protein [Thermoanaerobaculia bacterium]|jgi:signal transduction histidine kinase|nr:ATP-binding protein [Thermoanaerobaculia bacterium]
MIIRSLRWRLVVPMVLIIAAAISAAGVFSTFTYRRELDKIMVEQRRSAAGGALDIIRAGGDLRGALERVHARDGTRSIVISPDGDTTRYPRELDEYRLKVLPDGLELRRQNGPRLEAIVLKTQPHRIDGVGTVYFLPPSDPRVKRLRLFPNRWLVIGLGAAAVLAVLVMLTIFRRVFAPVEALTVGARALAHGRLDARVPVRGEDEVAELGRAFNSMAEALERNERARRNMVSDVAHELRTPLTNIRVHIEAAQDGVVAADAKFLGSIEEEAATLARLVDDLQQLSLAEAGQLRLELAEVRVAEIVERAVTPTVVCNVPQDLVVRADARRMVQVVRNLVNNALVHAESRVEVSAARVGDGVEIRVADDGPGVPPEHVERIFDRFYRVDESRSRSTGGAGLGLAIAKQLVELHGGRIWYDKPAFVIALP